MSRKAHHQADAVRRQSAASQGAGTSTSPRKLPLAPAGVLLDFRAANDEASLQLLAATAVTGPAGCPLDGAVSLTRPAGEPLVIGTSGSAVELARADLDKGDGLVSRAMAGIPTVMLNSYTTNSQWPTYWRSLEEAGYRSILSVPLTLGQGPAAALTLLSGEDNIFTPSVTNTAVAFSSRAGASYQVAKELRRALSSGEQLRSAMRTRTPIDVACGVIMGQNRCSYEEAFTILTTASSHRNVKVRVLAETILHDRPGGAPDTHFGQ